MKTGGLSVTHGVAHRNSPSIAPTAMACQPESNNDNYETQRRHTPCYRATVGAQLEVSVRVPNFAAVDRTAPAKATSNARLMFDRLI
jgi:hypothetical protein